MWAITKAAGLVHGGFAKFATGDGQSGAWASLKRERTPGVPHATG
jgi:hypothetical protein